jgi:UDP-N-acetyl-D-mannosaminuronic acid dehydrogenase
MCELTENGLRDVNIAFANQPSIICAGLDMDVWEHNGLANIYPRVNILQPGPGVGGHCIAVDPWFIVSKTPQEAPLIRTARQVNDGRPHYVVDVVLSAASTVTDPVITCLGLAFKLDINDLREGPAVEVVQLLAGRKTRQVIVAELHIEYLPPSLAKFENIEMVSAEEAVRRANIIAMLVSHQVFYALSREQLLGKHVIDTRGVLQ